MTKFQKIGIVVLLVSITILFSTYYSIFIKKINLNQDFYIQKGDSYNTILNNLKKQKIIKNKLAFKIYSSFNDTTDINAGKYVFMGQYNIPEIFRVVKEDVISQIKTKNITIIEGWNKYDVAKYLSNEFNVEYNFVLDFIKSSYKKSSLIEKYKFLDDKNIQDLEGYIYPDTYEVYENTNLEKIFDKILSNFENKVVKKYNLDNDKLYETLKIASLIEKEARFDNERPIISGIIYNRIENGMKLQIDATIVYFSKDNGNIAEDKNIDNPYNTYTRLGLPIGAISNPSIKSIDAAVNPDKTDYLFYIHKSDGEAVFAKTLEEHNRNINLYLK